MEYLNENTIPYNLRNGNSLLLPPAKSVKFGINSMIFRGNLLWNNLPLNLKRCQTIDEFNAHALCVVDFVLSAIYRYFIYLFLMYTF